VLSVAKNPVLFAAVVRGRHLILGQVQNLKRPAGLRVSGCKPLT